ncbi:MAG: GDSL-type esterase/lipase family protein [Pirellulaceae bacterium]
MLVICCLLELILSQTFGLTNQESVDKPHVLILGDSISMAYTPFVAQELNGIANVSRPTRNDKPENCNGTTNAIVHLERWIEQAGSVDIIFFNFGLHDLKREDPATHQSKNTDQFPRQAEPDVYEQQLNSIAKRLKETGAKLVFVTTTPVPSGGVKPYRSIGDPIIYNAIARRIMEDRGIDIVDLYTPALANQNQWQQPVNVHFNATGSEAFAKIIADKARVLIQERVNSRFEQETWTADPRQVKELSEKRQDNYREELVPTLPDLRFAAENVNLSAENWPIIREAFKKEFETKVYGQGPVGISKLEVSATNEDIDISRHAPQVACRRFDISISLEDKPVFQFPFLLFSPANATNSPTILLIHNRERPDPVDSITNPTEFLPIELIVNRGFAVAVVYTQDIEPDANDAAGQGIRHCLDQFMEDSNTRRDYWGALSAWAWGASRALDVLQEEPVVDAKRVYVLGHSRGGKTALWAAVRDTRFAGAIANESGCMGAALSQRRFGETITTIGKRFPYWFAPHFQSYVDNEGEAPVDQHQLIALIAEKGSGWQCRCRFVVRPAWRIPRIKNGWGGLQTAGR